MPNKVSPEAVTAKAVVPGNRSRSSDSAIASALASAGISASPATSAINAGGRTANTATSDAPNTAKTI